MSYDSVRTLLSRGVSRPALYRVTINFPDFLAQETNRQLEFLCSKASVPPAAINTIAIPGQEALGVTREQPTAVIFNSPFTISVISDRDYTVYKDLKRWYNAIAVNANPSTRLSGALGNSQRIKWYRDFSRTIQLTKLEQQGGKGSVEADSYIAPFDVIFNRAFPVRIGEITLDSSASDSFVEYSVDFAYETYTFESGSVGRGGDAAGVGIGGDI